MANKQLQRIKTINEYHRFRGLPKPEHPLISVIDYATIRHSAENNPVSWVFDFYSISLKRDLTAKMKYGQQEYDFDEGTMFFISPGQVFSIELQAMAAKKPTGWILLIHPDFLWNTPLAKTIRQYEYFDYSVNEALFLSDKEETTITGIMQSIQQEYHTNIDKFSQDIIIAQLEVLSIIANGFITASFLPGK